MTIALLALILVSLWMLISGWLACSKSTHAPLVISGIVVVILWIGFTFGVLHAKSPRLRLEQPPAVSTQGGGKEGE